MSAWECRPTIETPLIVGRQSFAAEPLLIVGRQSFAAEPLLIVRRQSFAAGKILSYRCFQTPCVGMGMSAWEPNRSLVLKIT